MMMGDFMRALSRTGPISLMFKSCLLPSTPGLMFTHHVSTEEGAGEFSCCMRYLSNPSVNERPSPRSAPLWEGQGLRCIQEQACPTSQVVPSFLRAKDG
jgi:hypothetical protein